MGRDGDRATWFAERTVSCVGDDAARDVVTIWIERKPGAVWAVGRAVNLAERQGAHPRRDDYVFEGYELGDALAAANDALESDVAASPDREAGADPFTEPELLAPLERWFFGHAPRGTRR